MCGHKRRNKFSTFNDLDKGTTLKEQIQQLVEVPETVFNELITFQDHLFADHNVRCIGYITRYYNDYNELLAVQDGIDKFYVKGSVLEKQ